MTSRSYPEQVTLGVIGCGLWGPKLVRTFTHLPGARVKVISDLRSDRLELIKQHYPEIMVATDYRAILADSEIDAVCVATPPESHYAIARDVLESGKHLLLEKPMTTRPGEARELFHLAEKKGLTLLVDHIFLYNPAVAALKKMIEIGEFGELYYLDFSRINLGPPDAALNVLWDLAPHDISICLHLFGEVPESVSAHGNRYRLERLEDVVTLRLFFPSGRFALVHVSWLSSNKTRLIRIFGAEKSAVYDDSLAEGKVRVFGRGKDTRLSGGAAPLDHSYGPDMVTVPALDTTEPLYNEGLDFLECLSMGKEPVSSGHLGCLVVCVLKAAGRSITQMGKAVKIQAGM